MFLKSANNKLFWVKSEEFWKKKFVLSNGTPFGVLVICQGTSKNQIYSDLGKFVDRNISWLICIDCWHNQGEHFVDSIF